MVQLLRIPRHLNMRRNFDRREAGASPSLSNGYPRTTDASRACIQRASPFPPSLPPSNDLRFSPTHVNIPRSLQPLSPCLYSLHDPHARAGHTRGSSNVCIAKCVRYWQSGERHFHRKAAVSEAVPFYVLRPIVNTPTRRRRVPLSASPRRMLVHFSKYLCSNGLVEYCGGRDESRLRLLLRPCKRIVDLISRYVGTLPSVADAIFDVR